MQYHGKGGCGTLLGDGARVLLGNKSLRDWVSYALGHRNAARD